MLFKYDPKVNCKAWQSKRSSKLSRKRWKLTIFVSIVQGSLNAGVMNHDRFRKASRKTGQVIINFDGKGWITAKWGGTWSTKILVTIENWLFYDQKGGMKTSSRWLARRFTLSMLTGQSWDYAYENGRSVLSDHFVTIWNPHFSFQMSILLWGGIESIQITASWPNTFFRQSLVIDR